MMRTPTPRDQLYAEWRKMLAAVGDRDTLKGYEPPEDLALRLRIDEDEPLCGFYKKRFRREGVFVPARIYMEQHVDRDGYLTQPEELRCEIGDTPVDPVEAWLELVKHPIPERTYRYMMEVREWAQNYAPHAPEANPHQPIDFLTRPPPVFKRARRR